MTRTDGPEALLADLLEETSLVIACGPGGVGKTTTAAALGLAAAASLDARVLVLTVDPARRLADALGLDGIGNDVAEVPASFFTALGHEARGSLSVAMLDAGASWDRLIRTTAPSPEVAEEIISNPLYRNITTRFARGHEYIAMERIFELVGTGEFDLLILDTPPSQSAIDLLDAPERMADFFSSRLLGWLTAPLRSRLLNFATRPFTALADRVLGTQFLTDTSRFFLLLQGMYDGFVERSNAVAALLREPTTLFVVVTTPETIPVNEARRFVDALKARSLRLGVVIANKVLPSSLLDADTLQAAGRMVADTEALEADLAESGIEDAGGVARVLAAISENFENFAVLAGRQRALLDELRSRHDVVIELPHLLDEVVDVEALSRIGNLLLAEPTG